MKKWIAFDRFFGFQLIRLLVALLLLSSASPLADTHLHTNLPLIGSVMLAYNVVLYFGRRVSSHIVPSQYWSLSAVFVDFAVAEVILVEYSRHLTSFSWVLLPVLAYEAWAYWGGQGLITGTLITVLMMLTDGWLARTVWHHPISTLHLAFWVVFLIVMAIVPIGISALPSDTWENPTDPETLPLKKLTPRERGHRETRHRGPLCGVTCLRCCRSWRWLRNPRSRSPRFRRRAVQPTNRPRNGEAGERRSRRWMSKQRESRFGLGVDRGYRAMEGVNTYAA